VLFLFFLLFVFAVLPFERRFKMHFQLFHTLTVLLLLNLSPSVRVIVDQEWFENTLVKFLPVFLCFAFVALRLRRFCYLVLHSLQFSLQEAVEQAGVILVYIFLYLLQPVANEDW